MNEERYHGVGFAILLVACVYFLTAFFQLEGFWIVDNANKFLQVESIINSHFSDYSLPWKGQSLDPDFRFNPLPSFSVVENGRIYSIYSPFFALISTGPYLLFGFHGLILIPILASLLLLLGIARICAFLTDDRRTALVAVIVTAFATPLWFYGVVFWEHVPAAAAGVWSFYFCLRAIRAERIVLFAVAGVLAAIACFFREEYVLFAVALLLVFYPKIPSEKKITGVLYFILSGFLVTIPFVLFQFHATGHHFGFHTSSLLGSEKGIGAHLLSRWEVFYNLVLACNPNRWLSILMTAPFLLLLFVPPGYGEDSVGSFAFRFILSCALISSIVYLCFYLWNARPVLFLLDSVNSFFVCAPLLALACWKEEDASPRGDTINALRQVAILFVVFYWLTAPVLASRGIHWGNRFLFPVYPLLSLVAAVRLEKFRKTKAQFIRGLGMALIILSIGLQIYSIRLLYLKTHFSYAINQAIQKSKEDVVISDIWWAPQELYSSFFEKAYFYVRSQQEYNDLVKKLSSQGIRSFLIITQPKERPGGEIYPDYGLGYFSLQFIKMSEAP